MAANIQDSAVAIIGAGITGLLAAQALKKKGFKNVVVFERDENEAVRARDWTILIHWALPILRDLVPEEVWAAFPRAVCNPNLDFNQDVEVLPCFNGVTGGILFKSPTPGARRVTRQRLRSVLLSGVDVRWGKALTALTTSNDAATLSFADGETYAADFVFGADGTSSTVRELLLGEEASKPRLSGLMFATGIVKDGDTAKIQKIVDAHPVAAIMMGTDSVGGCGVMYADDPQDISAWSTFWVKIWKGEPINLRGLEAINYIKANTKGLCEPFQSAIDLTPDDSQCHIDEMKYWITVPWNNHAGRVALAGDAAHPMLPYRGQGLQHGIEDVKNYVAALEQLTDPKDAAAREKVMSAFDAELVERCSKAVQQSLDEAERSFSLETVSKMLMATQGHGKST